MPNPDWYYTDCSCYDCRRFLENQCEVETPRTPTRKPTWQEKIGSRGYDAASLGFKSLTKDTDPNRTVFLGVELEVEYASGDRYAYRVGQRHVDEYEALEKKFGDFIITKGDGSLTCGMEINTAPGTMGFHKLFDWKGTLKGMTEAGFKAQSTCGMHVHVSRAPLGDVRVHRIARFIYNADNFAFIRYIAGRHSSRWARIKDVNASSLMNVWCGGKYMALNLLPSNTIEFRLFASTLQPHRFMARLEFVAALVEFSGLEWNQDNEVHQDFANAERFMDWVLTKKKKYPNLFRKVRKFRGETEAVRTLGYKPRRSGRFQARAASSYARPSAYSTV